MPAPASPPSVTAPPSPAEAPRPQLWLRNASGAALSLAGPEATEPRLAPVGAQLDSGEARRVDLSRRPLVVCAQALGDPGAHANGCYLTWELLHEPPILQVKTFHFRVAPGSAGLHPLRQPLLLAQQVLELGAGRYEVELSPAFRARLSATGAAGPAAGPAPARR